MNCLEDLKLLIKSFDYFGQEVKLIFNNENKFSTVFGGLFSLLIYCLLISLSISLLINISKCQLKTNSR